MNAAVQCLFHIDTLTRYIVETSESDENPQNPDGLGCAVLRAYRDLIKAMASGNATIRPDKLKRAIGVHSPLFADHGQHDSHEFLITIIDALHEDLNQSDAATGRNPDTFLISHAREKYFARNRSKIADFFHGWVRNELLYEECGHVESIDEPLAFWVLPLDCKSS
jgi:ubiquitin carboxyl-terminal hydrolase 4/11/15